LRAGDELQNAIARRFGVTVQAVSALHARWVKP
jgi:hypothetical protein